MLADTREKHDRASLAMIEKIRAVYPIDEKLVRQWMKDSPVIFKQHILFALMHLGYSVSVFGSLYEELFSTSTGWARVGIEYPETREAVKIAAASGGVCVLAHPGVYHNFDIVGNLVREGLRGIEVWHPRQSKEDSARAEELADRYGLLKTGGTDFHGFYTTRPYPLGTAVTPDENLRELLAETSASPF